MGAQFPPNRIESVPPNPKNSIFSIRNRFIRLFTRSAGVPSDVPSRPPAIQSLFVSDWPRRIAGRQHGLDDCARLVQCFLRRDPMFLRAAIRPISLAGCAMVVSLMLAATSDPSCPATDMSSSPRIVLYGSRSRTRIIRSARSRSVSTSTCRTTAAFCLCTSTRNGGCVRYGSGRSLTFPNGPSFCCGAPPIRGTRCWQCARVISVPIWEASDGRLRLRASTNAMGFTRLDGMLGVAAVSDDPYRAIHECVRAAVTRTHIRMRS